MKSSALYVRLWGLYEAYVQTKSLLTDSQEKVTR
jgi:hypothetical protein